MHKTLSALITLMLGSSLAPLHADDKAAEQLKESLAKWTKLRDSSNGDYRYTVRWSSFTGAGNLTTITVKDNKVVERKFEEFGPPQPIKPGEKPAEAKPKWVETGKEIGDHKEGAPARTVDQMYEAAKEIVTAKLADTFRMYIKFDNQGILSHCFTRDTRIADDAPLHGIPPFQLQIKAKP